MSKKSSPTRHLKFAVLSTDVVVFKIEHKQLFALMTRVQNNPFYPDNWAAIGGLIRPEETAEQAVNRLLKDKGGITGAYIEQLYTFSELDRDPRGRVVSVAYLGFVRADDRAAQKVAMNTTWVPVKELPKLAYDHNHVMDVALERLRAKIGYTNIAQYFLPTEFTLSDLQAIYETVLGREVDKRNFRKKILATGMLRDTKRTRKEGVMRPAALYSFTSKQVKLMEII